MRCRLGLHSWRRMPYPLTTDEEWALADVHPVDAHFYRFCARCKQWRP